jgi:tetratricopeptide (TPR) repeat protein
MAGSREFTPAENGAVRMKVMQALDRAWAGRVGEAVAMLSADPAVKAHPFGRTSLGTLYLESGRAAEGLQEFSAAATLAPESGEARCNLGVALQRLGRHGEALAAFDAAIALQPANASAHFNRGNVLRLANRIEEAAGAFTRAVDLAPRMVEARMNRGMVQLMLGRPREALADLDQALTQSLGVPHAVQARAAALKALGQPMTPVPAGASPPPAGAQAAVARARVLVELGRTEEALALVSPIPRNGTVGAQALMAKASALWQLGRVSEAMGAGDAALKLDPGNGELHEEFAYYCLKLGHFARGWEEHEYRLERPQRRVGVVDVKAPPWQGEDLSGKRLLVLSEQGHGDTLQFVRYLPLLYERGAMLTVVAQPAIINLLRSLPVPVTWVEAAGDGAGYDYHVQLMSLPYRLATRLETIPAEVPYLSPDPAKVARWRERLGSHGFKIGIMWQGNPQHPSDHLRSVALSEFAPLASIPGVRLISLQARHGLFQLAELPKGMAVEELGPVISDNPDGMWEIAAVMASLDLVVAPDSAVVHLAGALGRPVWVALMADPDWRWLRGRDDGPWYPTMRLFRQKKAGGWRVVFAAMAAALKEWCVPATSAVGP